MKKLSFLVTGIIFVALVSSCRVKEPNRHSPREINDVEFERFIKNKPYTILYFWASWCGFSRSGLINDYAKNYQYLNNDTVQSLLIVASDTSSINSFMIKNKINVPYKCLHPGKYPILVRNIKDGNLETKFILDKFNFKTTGGFPTVLLVDSSFKGLMDSDKTKDALRLRRYFEREKQLKKINEQK